MGNDGDIEHVLKQVSVPNLREGPHRDRLKDRLLSPEYEVLLEGGAQMGGKTTKRRRVLQLAAGLLAAAFLVLSGWAGEKTYQRLIKREVRVDLGDGRSTWVPNDTPPGEVARRVEQLKERQKEVWQLIATKEYEFLSSFDEEGGMDYIYRFTFSDGTKDNVGFSMSLDDVDSLEGYRKKEANLQRQRKEGIREAVLAGKYRLIEMEPEWTHICVEKDTGKKICVLCVTLYDDSRVALVSDEEHAVQYRTSWQDHLDAIRSGEREAVDLNVSVRYLYEITLEDGSTTTFMYGGGTAKEDRLDGMSKEAFERVLLDGFQDVKDEADGQQ